MAIDLSLIRDVDYYFAALLQSQAKPVVYMRRYTSDFNEYGKCEYCYNAILEQVTNSNCPVCYGTGFTRGYSGPIQGVNSPPGRVYGFFTRGHIMTDWEKAGPVTAQEDQVLYLKLPVQPTISDLIIDDNDVRYLVGNHIEDWSWNGIQYGYVITVFQQDRKNSTRYNVPVPPTLSGNPMFNLSNENIAFSDAVQVVLNDIHSMQIDLIS